MNIENNSNISDSNFLRKIEIPKGEKTEDSSSIFDKKLVSNSKLESKELTKEDYAKILEEYNQNSDDKDGIISKIQDFFKNNGGGIIDDGKLPTAGPDIGMFHPGSNSHGKCPDPGMHPDGFCPGEHDYGHRTLPHIMDPSKPTQPSYIEYAYDLSQTFDINKEEN